MDGLSASAAGWAAVASGVFWLLYLVLLMVELSGKVAYTATYKAMGIVTGVLQAVPIVIVAAFLLEAFGSGSAALIIGGFIAGCAGALLIAMSILKMIPKGTRFEEVSDIMQSGFGLLAVWILTVSILSLDGSVMPAYVAVLGLLVGVGMVVGAVIVLIYGPISPSIANSDVPGAAVWLSYIFGGFGFIGYPVWVILVGVALISW